MNYVKSFEQVASESKRVKIERYFPKPISIFLPFESVLILGKDEGVRQEVEILSSKLRIDVKKRLDISNKSKFSAITWCGRLLIQFE